MRRLAQRLGVVPMALYKHVADKDELLDGMVDVVIEEFAPPDPALGWKDRVRQQLLSARRAVLRHPWARRAIESRTQRTPAVLAYMDAVAGTLIAGGFSADLAHHVMHALGNRIWGFSPEMFDESQSEPELVAPRLSPIRRRRLSSPSDTRTSSRSPWLRPSVSAPTGAKAVTSSSSSSSASTCCSTAPNGCVDRAGPRPAVSSRNGL